MFDKKLVTIIDKENSMYVGELVADRGDHFVIKNPVGIAYPRDKDGNVSIAVVPVMYEGFLSDKGIKDGVHFNFYTTSLKWYGEYIEFHSEFIAKYHDIFKHTEPVSTPHIIEQETPASN